MPQKEIAGVNIDVDDNGYMTNLDQWNKDIAAILAKDVEIETLTDRHWEVVDYIQQRHKEGVALSIRKVGKSGVVDIKEFYSLFPGGPLKKSSLIAGIPKPASCI
ncbi:MAG: TusE/DsrC/DsvC family sulfur relay protein [bacterium]|nr:TusE/DsrC/DsvC family sulfur relay protein [bacterium]